MLITEYRNRENETAWVRWLTEYFQRKEGLTPLDGWAGDITLDKAVQLGFKDFRPQVPTTGQLRISNAGLKFIKAHEGVVNKVYLDPIGLPTGGVGHLLTAAERARFPVGTPLSESQIDAWLRADIARFENAVNRLVTVPLNQNQFDALVSFSFNVGEGNLQKSTLLRLLNQRNYSGAAAEFGKWNRAGGRVFPGLTRRRAEERALFLK